MAESKCKRKIKNSNFEQGIEAKIKKDEVKYKAEQVQHAIENRVKKDKKTNENEEYSGGNKKGNKRVNEQVYVNKKLMEQETNICSGWLCTMGYVVPVIVVVRDVILVNLVITGVRNLLLYVKGYEHF